jgi:hypothetical protein
MEYFGWEAGIRTPISRSRVCCPTVERPPSNDKKLYGLAAFTVKFAAILRPANARCLA